MSLLDEKRKKYGIPALSHGCKGKVVLVYRLPPETMTAGGLYVPEEHQEQKRYGILLAAGLTARDEMRDHLIELGDTVFFGRFAGDVEEIKRDPENRGKAISTMMIADIHGSVEQLAREEDHVLAYDEETGEHYWEPKKTDIKRKAR